MKELTLYTSESCAVIIIKDLTGITYDIQCGGMWCWQRKVEGFISTSIETGTLSEIESYGQLIQEDNDIIILWFKDNSNKLFNLGFTDVVLNIEDSLEAFVSFKAKHYELGAVDCILSWENCD